MWIYNRVLARLRDANRLKKECLDLNSQISSLKSAIDLVHNRDWAGVFQNLNQQNDTAISRSLFKLAENYKAFWTEEEHRNWQADGIIKMNGIINLNPHDHQKLSDDLIQHVVKWTRANQGAIFMVNRGNTSDLFFNLMSCYAYNRKKFIQKEIPLEQGLIGQCYLENDVIYITQVPANYIKITSGLGEALPRCLIIVPLSGDKGKMGVMELAFFHDVKPHEQEFLKKAGELICSAFANIQTNKKLVELVRSSEKTTQELRSREEDLLQNVEKLRGIQESLSRKNKELADAKTEIEKITHREKELIESQLQTQRVIHEKVVSTLKMKLEKLQNQFSNTSDAKQKLLNATHTN